MKWNNPQGWRAREPWDSGLYGVACAIINGVIGGNEKWNCEVKDATYQDGSGKSFILSIDGEVGSVDVFVEDIALLACAAGPDRWAKCAALMVPLVSEAHNLIIVNGIMEA